MEMKCTVCGKPAPWIFRAKVPLCSEHYHQRVKDEMVFVIEVKSDTDMKPLLDKYTPEAYTGRILLVKEEQLSRVLKSWVLGFAGMQDSAIMYARTKDFEILQNTLYYD